MSEPGSEPTQRDRGGKTAGGQAPPAPDTGDFLLSGPACSDAVWNLLFGLLACHLNFLGRDALPGALHAWASVKTKSLGSVLIEQRLLTQGQVQVLETVVTQWLQGHGDDPWRSLAELTVPTPLRQNLHELPDPDLRAGLETLTRLQEDGTPVPSPGHGGSAPRQGSRYDILRPFARGGLGEVFVARDRELHRQVALKEINPAYADDPRSQARFLLEGEVTGSLEHPGVVPVYGLGRYADGQPFYAMRLIQGETLKEAIRRLHDKEAAGREAGETRRELRALLGRFVMVCNTMGYAHSRGVLHRDLKPSNILLGKFGETLVVDWGLAKVLGSHPLPDGDERPLESRLSTGSDLGTELGQACGTPAYMSPEQAGAATGPLGPASDIYSLGATLYHLLTGRPPFTEGDAPSLLERVRHGAWQPPRAVKPRVPPALDAICRKAMALRPEERYATALDLAADVENWLAGEPTRAWPAPWNVRLGRWVRRHRAGVFAGVAAVGVAALCLAVATVLLIAAHKRAEALAAMACDTVDSFSWQIAQSRDRGQGAELLRQNLLEGAVHFYRRLAQGEAGGQLVRARAAAGQVSLMLSNLHRDLGEWAEARTTAEQACETFRQPAEAYPGESLYQRNLGRSYLTLGTIAGVQRRHADADWARQQAIRIFEALVVDDDPVSREDLAESYADLGASYYDRGLCRDAETALRKALTFRERLADLDKPEYQKSLAQTHLILGNLFLAIDRSRDAEGEYQQVLATAQQLSRRDAREPDYQLLTACAHFGLGGSFFDQGRTGAAIREYQGALSLLRTLATRYRRVAEYREALARTLDRLGTVYRENGQAAEAETAYQEAQTLCQELSSTQLDWYAFFAAQIGQDRGVLNRETGRLAAARSVIQEARKVYEAAAKHSDVFNYRIGPGCGLVSAGDVLRDLGKSEEALACYDRAIGCLTAPLQQEPHHREACAQLCRAYVGQAVVLSRLAQPARAEEALGQASARAPEHCVRCGRELTLGRALVWAHAGDYLRAATEADRLDRDRTLSGRLRYDLACVYSLCAAAAGQDGKLAPGQRHARRDHYAARAVAMLCRARDAGYFREALMVKRVQDDPELGALQGHADFQRLVGELRTGAQANPRRGASLELLDEHPAGGAVVGRIEGADDLAAPAEGGVKAAVAVVASEGKGEVAAGGLASGDDLAVGLDGEGVDLRGG